MDEHPRFTEPRILKFSTDGIAVRCAPELGGRVFSLVNRRTGREWLWRRGGERDLFAPANPLDFGTGCFAGLDECVPSVGACRWTDGRAIADHGEVWAQPWAVDAQSEDGVVLSVTAPAFGLRLTRALRLREARVRFDYTLTNVSEVEAPALWCMHPLFTWEEGDRLTLPATVERLRVQGVQPELRPADHLTNGGTDARPFLSFPEMMPGVRLDELALADNDAGFLKVFTAAFPGETGRASLWNAKSGDRLAVSWDARAMPYLGIWLTRGGFRGWHHVALEPTNAPHDRADVAAQDPALASAVTLSPGTQRAWWVEWQVS